MLPQLGQSQSPSCLATLVLYGKLRPVMNWDCWNILPPPKPSPYPDPNPPKSSDQGPSRLELLGPIPLPPVINWDCWNIF